MMDIIKC